MNSHMFYPQQSRAEVFIFLFLLLTFLLTFGRCENIIFTIGNHNKYWIDLAVMSSSSITGRALARVKKELEKNMEAAASSSEDEGFRIEAISDNTWHVSSCCLK